MMMESYLSHMVAEDNDRESEILKEMFEEIMKMIREKQIRLEAIIQKTVDQDTIPKDTFNRIYKLLTEYGKKKQWL